MLRKLLKNPPNSYRPAPFWSWNEKLDPTETVRQIDEMEQAGLGGFFMHARGGLQTEYLSEEWFENIDASIERAKQSDMWAWGYDENGWPSGFGNGIVNGMGLAYQQKYLRCEKVNEPKTTEYTIANVEREGQRYHLYFEVNPFYVDTLDKKVIAEFLKSTYDRYANRKGGGCGGMKGFFTDEPQVSRNGLPWSFVLEKEYLSTYGEPLLPVLPLLFEELEGYRAVRYRFWKLVGDLFAEAFNGQIQAWCKEHGVLYTGHVACEGEEGFHDHITSNGACMPLYEYMDIPGMDHLGRSLADLPSEMQLSSACHQLSKKQILSETFALCGWNVSFEDLRWIYESQMVHGITWLCQHLEGYSLRGIRKRDYPASLFRHQPWWKDYRRFNDTVSRIGVLLSEGRVSHEVLVLHSIPSAWCELTWRQDSIDTINTYRDKMLETMLSLEWASIPYHLGDERLMKRHGSVQDGHLTIGSQSYRAVVVPPALCLGQATVALLQEFKKQGGLILFTEQVPTLIDGKPSSTLDELATGCPVVSITEVAEHLPQSLKPVSLSYDKTGDEHPVAVAIRRFDAEKMTLYYLVNPNSKARSIEARVFGKSATLYDPVTNEEKPVYYHTEQDNITIKTTLQGRGSVLLFVHDEAVVPAGSESSAPSIPLNDALAGDWKLSAEDNALTLDTCDLYFEGKLAAKNLPICDVQEKACAFGRAVETEVVYHFTVKEDGFSRCRLAVEIPQCFTITVNGKEIDKTDLGFYHDPAFRLLDIRSALQQGENEIRLSCLFEQAPSVYENLKNALAFESEKNKLSYTMEIEAVYLVGDFAVRTDAPFEALERRALRTTGGFYLTNAPQTATVGNMAEQGYPFFAGSMTFTKNITLLPDETKHRSLVFERLCSTVTTVRVNGKEAGQVMWQPYCVELDDLLVEGENEISVTITGNLRNLLGPFHLGEGECLEVCPPSFIHESPVWVGGINPDWVDSYCFVEFGLFL